MKSMLRQFRRAPGRITATTFALALAVGAIGVLAIPAVSSGTLREAAAGQGLADIIVDTTSLDASQLATINRIDNVAAAEGQGTVAVRLEDGFLTRLVGLDFDTQTMDIVQLSDGRLPTSADEVVASDALGALGDREPFDVEIVLQQFRGGNDFAQDSAAAEQLHLRLGLRLQ